MLWGGGPSVLYSLCLGAVTFVKHLSSSLALPPSPNLLLLCLVAVFPVYFLETWAPVHYVFTFLDETGRLEKAAVGGMPFPSREKLLKNSFPLTCRPLLRRNLCPHFTIITLSLPLPEPLKGSFSDLYHENLVSFLLVKPIKVCPPTPQTAAFRKLAHPQPPAAHQNYHLTLIAM